MAVIIRKIIPISMSKVYIYWEDLANETGYQIERSPDGVGSWTLIASPVANSTFYRDTGLTENTDYYYRIRGVGGSDTDWSAVTGVLTKIRERPPLKYRMFLLDPEVVFAARVNQVDAAEYPIDFIPYDTVTVGTETDISPGMTVLIGSFPGGDDYGRQRVRTDATSISIFVGRSSRGTRDGELVLVDNAYVTVVNLRLPWAKIPYIDPEGNIYKDSNLEVEWRTTTPPPVANCGSGTAGTAHTAGLYAGTLPVGLTGANSLAISTGATITNFLWNVIDGTIITGTSTDAEITATFPPGFRYVSLTVTDSNGKEHTSYCPVFVDDPDERTSFEAFDIDQHGINEQGQALTITVYSEISRTIYPDKTLCMIWEQEPITTVDRDHMVIIGWLDEENADIGAQRYGLKKGTSITVGDMGWWLSQLPGFPQSLTDDTIRNTELVPEMTWNYMIAPNMLKYLHYLLYWNTTALELCDLLIDDDVLAVVDDYVFVMLGSDGSNIWDQVDRRVRAMIPDKCLTCDRKGRLLIVYDPMLQNEEDRTDEVMADISESNWSDIQFVRRRHPRSHWLRSGAVLAGTTQPIGTVFAIAPGNTPGQGVAESKTNERLALSQQDLNDCEGHRYARENSEYTSVEIDLVQDDADATSFVPWRTIEPASKKWVTITMSAATAAQRGITWTERRALVHEVRINYSRNKYGIKRKLSLECELEVFGEAAETEVQPEPEEPDDTPAPIIDTEPPPLGLVEGQDLLALISTDGLLYVTSNFTNVAPTWVEHDVGITDEVYTWVVDPFSDGYVGASGPINGWVATENSIFQINDLFGTPSLDEVVAFAVPAQASELHWRSIQASFGAFFGVGQNPWLVCVSYYGDTTGHEGTWACFSKDGGFTWSEESQISAEFASTPDYFLPIGIYTSPKTPGLAYTVAKGEDLTEGLPHFVYFNTSGVMSDLGAMSTYDWIASRIDNTTGDGGVTGTESIMIAPPTNAARVEITVNWVITKASNASGNVSSTLTVVSTPSTVDQTNDNDYDNGTSTTDETLMGSFSIQALLDTPFISNDWPGIISQIGTAAGDAIGDFGIGLTWNATATAISGAPPLASILATISITITEIELEDGTIYTFGTSPSVAKKSTNWGENWIDEPTIVPDKGMGGTIHLPWLPVATENDILHGSFDVDTTRQFRLIRVTGGTPADVSPSSGGIFFGPNRGHFGVRTFDGNGTDGPEHVLLAGVGNDTTDSISDDTHAVFYSVDGGDNWVEIIAPISQASAPAGRPGLEAAFGGDTPLRMYFWGLESYISYSEDGGDTVEDKSGDLPAGVYVVGIAGGPTP